MAESPKSRALSSNSAILAAFCAGVGLCFAAAATAFSAASIALREGGRILSLCCHNVTADLLCSNLPDSQFLLRSRQLRLTDSAPQGLELLKDLELQLKALSCSVSS